MRLELRDLARYYHHWYARNLSNFTGRYQSDLFGAFKNLQDDGYIQIATSAATHGYLPLLARDSSIYGQIRTGADAYQAAFWQGSQSDLVTGVCIPACLPRRQSTPPVDRPGLESFLAPMGLEVFFSETHTVEGGEPVGKAAGEAIGLYGVVMRRYKVKVTPETQPNPGTTFRPYWVGDAPGQVARPRPQ